jgi:hypothetical protein
MNPIIIEALLVRSETGNVRMILEPYFLDFAHEDIVDVVELPLPRAVSEGSAIAARVTLRPGARLMRLGSAEPYRDALWTRDLPFALITRIGARSEPEPTLLARETAFLDSRGLRDRFS